MAERQNKAPPVPLSSLRLRILSALVLIPAAVGVFYMGGWILMAVVAAVGTIMVHEWLTISTGRATPLLLAVQVAGVVTVSALVIRDRPELAALAGLIAASAAALAARLFRQSPTWVGLGAVYVLVPCFAILWLREAHPSGFTLSLWYLIMVWATDIGAFLVGSRLGGPLLAPHISPRKTWSGLLGGMIFSAILGLAAGLALGLAIEAPLLLLAGAVLAAWGQIGDLAESAIKRRFGVKDSGSLIPGHGGILDRVDGLVFVAPLVALAVAVW